MKKILSVILAITLTLTLAQGFCVMAAEEVQTAYGNIPAEYADASAYPIVVFFSDKTFWHAGADWDSAIRKAVQICDFGSYGANILIRSDITVNSQYTSLEYMRNPLTIDLGGNAVTLAGGYLGQFANKFSLNVTVKDGSFILTDYALFDNFVYYDGEYTANMNYENLTFSYGAGAKIKDPVLSFTHMKSSREVINETYTNCTFDFRENCPENTVLFKVGTSAIEKNITVNGCALLSNDIGKINIMSKNNDASSIVFAQYNDEYMTISVPENTSASDLEAYTFPTSSGDLSAVFESNENGYDTYQIGVAQIPAEPVGTAYGNIPVAYADANAYPFAVFFSDKTFWHAGADWKTAMDKAISISSMNYGAVILIRSDITITEDDEFNNVSYITKPLVIDLDGNNVELEGAYLGLFENKNTLDVTVKNGSFTITKYPVFKNFHFNSSNSVYSPVFKFEDVTFSYGSGATITDPVIGDYVAGTGAELFTETYTNCTFDFRNNCPNGIVLFQLGIDEAGIIKHNVTVNGCKLLADDMSKITVMQKNNTGSSIVFDKYNGEYMTISVPTGSDSSAFESYVFPTAEGELVANFDSAAEGYDTYKLGTAPAPVVPVETAYGKIPAEYADASAYPIAVFFSDKTFWHAGADWSAAMDKALGIAGYGYGANILIRNDLTINSQFDNLEYMTKPLTIDLGGNNVNLAGGYLGMFSNRFSLNVTVKNGSFTITQYPVFKNFHYYGDSYAASLNFEDVTFTYGSGATVTDPVLGYYVAGAGTEVINETFTNCTFDFRANCPENVVLFKLGIDEAGVITHNVTVNGCKLLADDMSKITVMQKNNTGSSIVFDKYNGEYMTISVPEGSAVCKDVFPLANEMRRYVLDSTNEGTSLYKLVGGIFMVTDGSSVSAYNIDRAVNLFIGAYSSDNTLIDVVMGGGSTDTTVYTADLDKTGCVEIRAFLWGDECTPLCLPLDIPLN